MHNLKLQASSLQDIADKHPDEAKEMAGLGYMSWLEEEYPDQVKELRLKGLKLVKNLAYEFRGIDRTLQP